MGLRRETAFPVHTYTKGVVDMKDLSFADAVAKAIGGLVRVAAYEGVTIEEIREM